VVGRESGQVVVSVTSNSGRRDLEPVVLKAAKPGAEVHTDEWLGYCGLEHLGFGHKSVTHRPPNPEWARDDDGDGVREVHCNTIEGIWTGLRNFLRPFRGVSKWYLLQYVAMFAWGYDLKQVSASFLGLLLGKRPSTDCQT
jgi:hypothetical protein